MGWIIAIFLSAVGISALTVAIIFTYSDKHLKDTEIEVTLLQKERERRKRPKRPALDHNHHIPWTG